MGGNSHSKPSSSSSSSALVRKAIVKTPLLTILEGGEQMLPSYMPIDIANLIHSYWNFDCTQLTEMQADSKLERPLLQPRTFHQSFFQPSSLAALVAHYISFGQLNEVMAIAEKYPEVMNIRLVIESKDHRGRRFQGNLLRTAFFRGSLNPFVMSEKEKPHGIAENLAQFARRKSLLTEEAIQAQKDAQFPPEWEKEMARIMQPLSDAGEQLIDDVFGAPDGLSYDVLEEKCKPYIDRFNTLIEPNPNDVFTIGLSYDLGICDKFWDSANNKMAARPNWDYSKMALVRIVGYGGYQRLAPADDAHAVKNKDGLWGVVQNRKLPVRSLLMPDGSSYYSVGGLGKTFFIDDIGGRGAYRAGAAAAVAWGRVWHSKLMSSKNISLAQFMRRSDNPSSHESATLIAGHKRF